MAAHSHVAQFLSWNAGNLNRAATCDKVQDFLASQWTIACIQEANAESTLHSFRVARALHCFTSTDSQSSIQTGASGEKYTAHLQPKS